MEVHMVAESITGRRLSKVSFRICNPVLALLTVLMLTLPMSVENAFSAVTLNWTAPSTNTDGTPLTDLSGYNLYYGTSSGTYTNSITLTNVITYTLNNLSNGTYYFVVTAYTTAGLESTPSNEVSKTESLPSDTTPPTVNAFTIPPTATSLPVSITSFTATDDVGVTGYLVNESATTPAASAAGWSATAPTSYTFTTAGTKTLYAWAKDAAGNVSTSLSASVTITIDTTAPTVTGFTIPATATSLTVLITSLTATDNIGVTGYLVNESATAPAASAAGWSATAPTSHTFTTAGTKTLYAWAKDAAGNVSTSRTASTTITLPDTTPPLVTVFTIPATATSLTVSITSLTATDNVGVTGYLVNESATAPAASAAGWSATAPTSHTFTTAGTKTLYAWAKDAAGNVSTSRTASTTITLPDTTPPLVTVFTIPATATSLTISITSLTATDNVGVTGYLVNESATAPAASAAGWSATAPTSHTFTTAGTKTLYAWAKDAAGNVSTSLSASVTITIDTTAPTVTGFTMPATATSLNVPITLFTATDNIAVTGYIVTETATAPATSAAGWSATAPTSHTTSAAGSRTFYAWAKDAAGKVSTSMSATVSITAKQSYRGVFRKGIWYMDMNQNGIWDASADTASPFGTAGDIPVMGDWDGTGTKKIGVFRNGMWYLDMNGNNAWDPGVDVAIPFGTAGDIPVVGDWNGDGRTKIGVFRNGMWYLDYSGTYLATGTWASCGAPTDPTKAACISFGVAGDIPVVGNWNGSVDGKSEIGVFRNGYWYLDTNGNNAWDPGVDAAIPFGTAEDIPVVGDWNGDGKTKIGVFRNGYWYVDTNGNNAWDPEIDSVMTWGMAGDKPIVK